MRTLICFLADEAKKTAIVRQLYFSGEFLQEKLKNRVFVKLDSRYEDYIPEYSNDFGRALRLMKSMYGMTNSGKLFADELLECLIEAGFIQSHFQMFIYYKYAPNGGGYFVLSYFYD